MDGGTDDLYSGWYYSDGWKSFDDRVTIHGTVNIIITDSSYVRFDDGIHVGAGNTLNIYGQDRDDQYLEAIAESWDAAIGSDDESGNCGNINIYGGAVKADSTKSAYGDNAGIGSGHMAGCTNITINGGTINAEGGVYAAGIGSGHYKASCGDIYISRNAGVTVKKGEDAPDYIGAGYYNSTCGTVTIEPGANIVYN